VSQYQKGKTNLDFSASAGTYASLHLAPDRQPHQHPTTQFFTGRMPFLPPNQQRQSTVAYRHSKKARHDRSDGCVQAQRGTSSTQTLCLKLHKLWISLTAGVAETVLTEQRHFGCQLLQQHNAKSYQNWLLHVEVTASQR